MANIKELKKKIKSTQGILKITSAMKLVSAAKLNKATGAVENARPYREELTSVIETMATLLSEYTHPFLGKNSKNKKVALLIISADRGLCGAYHSGLFKEVEKFTATTPSKIYCIGKKAHEFFTKREGPLFNFESSVPTFEEINSIGETLGELFVSGEIGRVVVAYNRFYSALRIIPTVKTLLPLNLGEREKIEEEFPFDFKYEPEPSLMLDQFIPRVYTSLLYGYILDALAAEHGARMSAMDNAVNNCKDAIYQLTLKKNKLRQAAITTELIEVISGAESLKN